MKSAYISYISALLLFGSNGIIASFIDLSSTDIVLYRTGIGTAILLVLFLIPKRQWTFYGYKREFLFLLLSGVSMGASWMFLYEAYQQIGVSISSLLYYCGPVIVMILSPVIFKEKLLSRKVTGFLIVLAGMILINGVLLTNGHNFSGFFCGIMSACTYATMIIFNKKAVSITGLENALLQLAASFVTVSVFTLFREGFTMSIPEGSLLPLIVLGVFNTGIGCYLFFSKLEKLPVQTVSILGYLEPLSAVALSVIILGESLTFIQTTGAVLIIGGAVYAEK